MSTHQFQQDRRHPGYCRVEGCELPPSTEIHNTLEPTMVEREIVCPECEGAKTVERTATVRPWSDDPYEYIDVTCPECDGRGKKFIEVCAVCQKKEYDCTCLD